MRRYELVSGTMFAILSLIQLARTVLALPVQVDGLSVPVWPSGIAFLITAGLAIWAFPTAPFINGVKSWLSTILKPFRAVGIRLLKKRKYVDSSVNWKS